LAHHYDKGKSLKHNVPRWRARPKQCGHRQAVITVKTMEMGRFSLRQESGERSFFANVLLAGVNPANGHYGPLNRFFAYRTEHKLIAASFADYQCLAVAKRTYHDNPIRDLNIRHRNTIVRYW
jgi:hypothetical protein